MEQEKFWLCCLISVRGNPTLSNHDMQAVTPRLIIQPDREAAETAAMEQAIDAFPLSLGWTNHHVVCVEIEV